MKAPVGLYRRSERQRSSDHVQGSSSKLGLIGFEDTSEARSDWLEGFWALVGLYRRSERQRSSDHVQGSSPKLGLIGFRGFDGVQSSV
ncbi:hypothetical protein JCGZ_19483 [Jatropha curcas]|uniref:Uncharacterized protein n=1 Tax=Jatropha curcas TaxID=180498 RepID=A0A067K736_JATCU|nr:hypothetical protein JCGZ_19483 [Jatropha curcas]